jgi:hypothetical protein
MLEDLKYRLYQEDNFPGVARLWEEEAGWGRLTPEVWREWFVDTPYGPCLVVVALGPRGEVFGQSVFTPAEVQVGSRTVRALRLSAPILGKEVRSSLGLRSLHHPAVALWLTGAIAGASLGYDLVYALPDPMWLPFFQSLYRFASAEYRCLVAPLAGAEGGPSGWPAGPLTEFGPEHEALWEAARARLPIHCGVRRTPGWLRYRNGAHLVVEVRDPREGVLAGYVSVQRQTGLVRDLVACRAAALAPVLEAARRWLAAQPEGPTRLQANAIKVMEMPALEPALRELGFTPVDYHFAFVCDPLDPYLPAEAVDPGRWYVMPGD